MRSWLVLAVLALAGSANGLLSGQPGSPDAKDLEAMQGTWVVENMTRDGEGVSSKEFERMTRVVKGSGYVIVNETDKGKVRIPVKFKLDAGKSPKQIDLILQEGPLKDKALKGIYCFENQNQIICYGAAPDVDRPKEFKSTARPRIIMTTWKPADKD